MVLLCGYALTATELPYFGAVEYIIKNTEKEIKMLRRTKLLEKSSDICIVSEYVEYIPEMYSTKVHIFDDTDVLLAYLQTGVIATDTEDVCKTEVIAQTNTVEEQIRTPVKRKAPKRTSNAEVTELQQQLQEAQAQIQQLQDSLSRKESEVQLLNSDIETINLQIDEQTHEIETLEQEKAELSAICKDAELRQAELETELAELRQNTDIVDAQKQIDELKYLNAVYLDARHEMEQRLQAAEEMLKTERIQFETDKEMYQQMIQEAEESVHLNGIGNSISEYGVFGKRQLINAKLQSDEIHKGMFKNFRVITCAGDTETVLEAIRQNIVTGLNGIVVDITGSSLLAMTLKLVEKQKERGDIRQVVAGGDVSKVVQKRGNTDIVMSEAFNDVALYTVDWVTFLKNIRQYASERPVYILLGNISSFAVKYTFTLLASVMDAQVLLKATPHVLYELLKELACVPPKCCEIVCLQYVVGTLKTLLDKLLMRYQIRFVNTGSELELQNIK